MARRCGIWAGGIGLRWRHGALTEQLCYRLFTTAKRPLSRLRKQSPVPLRLRRHGTRLRTDLSARHRPRRDTTPGADLASTHRQIRALLNSDGDKLGTFGAWGLDGEGRLWGVAAGHFIDGADRLVDGRDRISAWIGSSWVPIGRSRTSVHSWGDPSNAADYGIVDAGSFTTTNPPAVFQPQAIFVPASLLDPWARGLGMRVFGEGAVSGPIEGVVTATLWASAPGGLRADLLIEHPSGDDLTRIGDSGMIWNNTVNQSVAMHVLGENRPGAGRYSIATYVFRIVDHLGLSKLGGQATG